MKKFSKLLLLFAISLIVLASCEKPKTPEEIKPKWSEIGKVNGCEFVINDSIKIVCQEKSNNFLYTLYLNNVPYTYKKIPALLDDFNLRGDDFDFFVDFYKNNEFIIKSYELKDTPYREVVDILQINYYESIKKNKLYYEKLLILEQKQKEYNNIKCFQK